MSVSGLEIEDPEHLAALWIVALSACQRHLEAIRRDGVGPVAPRLPGGNGYEPILSGLG